MEDENYHKSVEQFDKAYTYSLYPLITGGTRSCMFIDWAKNEGMASYSSWAGALNDYIAIFDDEHADRGMLNNSIWMNYN